MGRHLPPRIIDGASRFIRRARIGDLSDKGLAEPNDGLYERLLRTGMIPTIDGRFLEAVRRGELEIVAAVERIAGSEVLLSDGAVLTPDAVVAATGYSRDLDPLVGHLGVLDEEGRPQANGAREAPGAPRLWFVGFSEPLSGNLRELRLDAPKVARAVVRSLSGK